MLACDKPSQVASAVYGVASTGLIEERIAVAERALAAAPLGAGRWPSAIQRLAEACGGWCGHLVGGTADRRRLFEVRGAALRSRPERGDLHEPGDRRALILRLPTAPDEVAVLTVVREAGAPARPEERAVLRRLAPSLAAALRLQRRLEGEAADRVAGAFDALRTPAFLLDSAGRVSAMSGAGKVLARRATLLALRKGRLTAVASADQQRLQKAVDAVGAEPGLSRRVLLGGPVAVTVSRLPSESVLGLGSILVTLPAERNACPELLGELGLTPAEAAVCLACGDGDAPDEISRARKVSVTTVRAQIRAIYAKLDVNSSSQLIRKLRRLA